MKALRTDSTIESEPSDSPVEQKPRARTKMFCRVGKFCPVSCQRKDSKICPGTEATIERALGIDSSDLVAHGCTSHPPADRSDIPCDQTPPIGLRCQLFYKPVRTRIEARAERSVGIKAPEMV